MRKSSKTRSDNSASSSAAAERLADYRGNSGSAAAGGSSCNSAFGPASPNLSPSTPDTDNISGTTAATINICSTMLGKMSVTDDCYSGEIHVTTEVEQTETATKEAGKVCCFISSIFNKQAAVFKIYFPVV